MGLLHYITLEGEALACMSIYGKHLLQRQLVRGSVSCVSV